MSNIKEQTQKNIEILRVKCLDVTDEQEAEVLVNTLETVLLEMKKSNFFSVSAPQVNISKKASIIRTKDFSINLINPKIIERSNKIISFSEECNSFPGMKINCFRYNEITIENGIVRHQVKLTGKNAVLVQHEIDHLNQTLFFDKIIKIAVVRPNGEIRHIDFCPCGSKKKFGVCCIST